MTIHFRNPGHLPIRAATTLGISAKEGDSPIGKFGTGLKYTIAGVLRLGGNIRISIGHDIYDFAYEWEEVRGQRFAIVTMNGQPLGFTTALGQHWEPWMYVRELWSNMRDEQGTCGEGRAEAHSPDETVIEVTCPAIEAAYAKRHEFILTSREPLAVAKGVEYYEGQSHAIFYRGIKVLDLAAPTRYTYNLTGAVSITEDRLLSGMYPFHSALSYSIVDLKDESIILNLFRATENEDAAEFGAIMTPAQFMVSNDSVFHDLVARMWKEEPHRLPGRIQEFAKQRFGKDMSGDFREPNSIERTKIERAVRVCHALGLTKIEADDIRILAKPDEFLLGYAHEDIIALSSKCLEEGTATVVATLIEEYLHSREDINDYSRAMQDRLLRMIVRQYELRTGEAL